MSYGAAIHGIDSNGERGTDEMGTGETIDAHRVALRLRSPEERDRYYADRRADFLAAGRLDEVETLDAVRSVMDGETPEEWQARVAVRVLSAETLSLVAAEALRAHLKHKDHGGSLLDATLDTERRLAALGEEFGEVCRALTYDGGQGIDHLIKELVQTASVALTWAEYLRRANG